MCEAADVAVTLSSSEDRPVPPVLLRAVLRLVHDAMLHTARLRVAVAPQPPSLALLAQQLEALSGQVRNILCLRT